MGINIEIDCEIADKIMASTLIKDYHMVMQDINRLTTRGDTLRDYEQEDLLMYQKVARAIRDLAEWYLLPDDRVKLLNVQSYQSVVE
jgi:hypothetical protein